MKPVRHDRQVHSLDTAVEELAAEDFKDGSEPKQIKMALHFPLYMDRPTSRKSLNKEWNYKDLATRDDRPLE